jgi:hypothetical protein
MTRFRSDQPNPANGPKPDHRDLFHKGTTAIITDLDGCLVNLWEALQIYLWDRYQVWVPPEANRRFNIGEGIFEIMEPHGFSTAEELNASLWMGLWNSGIWYQTARPNFTYWQALLKWKAEAKEPIRYLTARPGCLVDSTLGWLHRWGLRTISPNVIVEGTSKDKLKHLKHWSETFKIVYIDDKIQTIIEVARAKLPNVRCILFAQPWNDADSPDWKAVDFILEGQRAHEHAEFDLFLQHGFPLGGFRRLTEVQIADAIHKGLE